MLGKGKCIGIWRNLLSKDSHFPQYAFPVSFQPVTQPLEALPHSLLLGLLEKRELIHRHSLSAAQPAS